MSEKFGFPASTSELLVEKYEVYTKDVNALIEI